MKLDIWSVTYGMMLCYVLFTAGDMIISDILGKRSGYDCASCKSPMCQAKFCAHRRKKKYREVD